MKIVVELKVRNISTAEDFVSLAQRAVSMETKLVTQNGSSCSLGSTEKGDFSVRLIHD